MKIRAKQLIRPRASSRDAIAAAVAAIIAGSAAQGWAQTAAQGDQPIEEVVVTGIRHSIETSIAAKRESTSVVEVVSAEDIGKLPDTSIADSIARLPGLAAQRIDGRPSQISIRGLGPDYSTALLNGRQVVSSSDGRDAEYDQFPSELVNQVIVYKTVDAGVVGQGLAGTIDIRPLMPLSLEHSSMNFGARGEHNTEGGLSSTGKGPNGLRLSASYVGQFADHTIGLAVGFAHLDSPGQHKQYSAWDMGDYDAQWGASATGVPRTDAPGNCVVTNDPNNPRPAQQCAVFQQGFESDVTSSKQVRDGLMSILEFKPNDNYHSVVDLYYSKFTQDRVGHHWVGDIGLWNGGGPILPVPPPADFTNVGTVNLNGNTFINSGTVGNAHSLIYDKNWNRTDKIFSIGWRNEFNLGSDWKAVADVGYSHSDRDELYIQSVARSNAYSSFTFSNLSDIAHASWQTPEDLTDPGVVQLTNDPNYAELRDPKYRDAIKSAEFTLTRNLEWGWFNAVDAGIAYNQRDKSVKSDQFFLQLAGGPEALVTIPTSALRSPVLIDVAGIHQDILSWDVPSIMSLYTAVPKDPWAAQTNKYGVHEKVTTAFLKFDINKQGGAVPFKGNIGVQVVHSEQNSDGFAWNDAGGSGPGAPMNGAVIPVRGGASYYDVLPSLNLVFNLTPDLVMRFGLGKTMARPRMDDMRAGADQPQLEANTGSTTQGHWVSNGGGKPDLKPWRAKSLDLSIEQYFKKRSYVAVAGFLKKLDSFIYQKDTLRDFSGFPNYNPALTPGCPLTTTNCNPNLGTITTQDNGTGGRVYGGEVSTSLDGSLISHSLDGIGLILSYAKTFDKLPLDNNGNPINLDGFSSNVNGIEAYFERGGFAARVSQRYRSAFTATTRGVVLQNQNSTQIDAERQIDAQIGYSFNEGSLKGLSILLQGNNLTNAPAIQRRSPQTVGASGNPLALDPWNYDTYGRVILFGATYKL